MPLCLPHVSVREATNPQIIAAITAAIAACIDSPASSWHITSVRPVVSISRRWLLKGRQELMSAPLMPERKCMAV